jgi:hypothetical protein
MMERNGLGGPMRVAVTPAKAGVHVRRNLDSRFRGNDVREKGQPWK